MKKTNGMILLSIFINTLLSFYVFYELPILGYVLFGFNALGMIGQLILFASDQVKLGAYLIIVSCAIHVPIGMIGVIGARKILDVNDEGDIEARKAFIKKDEEK